MSLHRRWSPLASLLLAIPRAGTAAADCNGNGVPDEIETIPLVLETATLVPLESAVLDVAATDLDGDGDLDAAAFTAAAVFVLRGDGRGGFDEASRSRLADAPTAALALHGNGDLHADLVIAGALEDVRGRGTISIHEGAGAGSFHPPRTLSVPPGPAALSAADLDGDGITDLAIACSRARGIAVLAGDGLGSFRETAFLAVEAAPFLIETTDLDGDGGLDIVAGDPAGALVMAFLRRDPGWTGSTTRVPRSFDTLALLDLQTDGDDELAVAGRDARGGGVLDLFELFDDGERVFLGSISAVSLPESPTFLAAADLDGDALPDLVTLDSAASSVTVRLGPRPQDEPFGKTHATRSAPRRAAQGDIDGDGDLDLLVAEAGGLGVLGHDGSAGFDAPRSLPVGARPMHTLGTSALRSGVAAPVDFDGDGRRDLAVTRGDSDGRCTVIFGVDAGAPEAITSFVAGFSQSAPAAADLNGDGLPDLAVGSTGQSGLALLPGLSIHLSARSRNFASAGELAEMSGVYSVVAADFDGDGDMDLASAGVQVALWENGGHGTFPRRRQLEAVSVIAADLDGDGDIDLASAGEIALLENLGDWDFAPARGLGASGVGLVAADLDLDGRLDLAAAVRGGVHILWNSAGGAFQKAFHRVSVYAFGAIAPGDLDGDGDPELAIASFAEGIIQVLSNGGARRLEALPALAVPGTVGSLEAADLDEDGRAEVLATMAGERSVLVFRARTPEGAARDGNGNRIPDACEAALFVRADADADGRVGIPDAIRILLHLAGGTRPRCEASADTDGDGSILPADASLLLEHLFGGGAPPAAPYPGCDVAPAYLLPCEEHPPCAG